MKAKTALIASIASVGIASAANADVASFSNVTPITIQFGAASVYPSNILVSGIVGTVTDINVTLTGFTHPYVYDVDILLVGPTGANIIPMSDIGVFGTTASNANITLDDQGVAFPGGAGAIPSGNYIPTNNGAGDPFAAPAPAPSGLTALSTFNGLDPNGTWSLYVMDDFTTDDGSISGGWSIQITYTPVPAPGAMALLGLAGMVGRGRRRR
jgi:hypothetical protein